MIGAEASIAGASVAAANEWHSDCAAEVDDVAVFHDVIFSLQPQQMFGLGLFE